VALALAGCGGGATHEARQLSAIGILERTSPLGRNLVRQSDLQATSDTAGVRTLMQFWQSLQYQDYAVAGEFFYPRLVKFLGVAQLSLALRVEAALWGSTKPRVISSHKTVGGARVVFVVHNLANSATPVTIAFRGREGAWRIDYFSLLDEALRAAAQQRTQSETAPLSQQPSAQALTAAARASRLQSEYLQAEHARH
jgi:hypothetical protein